MKIHGVKVTEFVPAGPYSYLLSKLYRTTEQAGKAVDASARTFSGTVRPMIVENGVTFRVDVYRGNERTASIEMVEHELE